MTLAFTATPPAFTNHTSATFEFHGSSASASLTCALDSAAAKPCTSPDTRTGLSEGSHTFTVTESGTTGSIPPISYMWTVDLTPPTTVVTSQPPALTNSQTATFAFTSPDLSATFQCSLNGSAPQPCTSPVVYTGLGDATRSLLIQAVDPAGNVDVLAQPITWTVDATPPDTTLQNPGKVDGKDVIAFQFTSTEAGSTFACSLDKQAFQACSSPDNVAVPGSGHHVFKVRAVDAAGNSDPTPATYTWTTDLTPPKRPTVAIFAAPGATARAAAAPPTPTPQKTPTIGVTQTNPVAKLLGTATFTVATKLQAQWSSDATAKSFDVTVEAEPQDSTGRDIRGEDVVSIQTHKKTKRQALTLHALPGSLVCVTVDAVDAVGNTSKSRTTCTTVPADVADPRLPRIRDAKAFGGYYVRLGLHGFYFVQDINDQAYFAPKQGALVAQRCPKCGTVEFDYQSFNGHAKPRKIATVNLDAPGHSGDFRLITFKLPVGHVLPGNLVIRAAAGQPRIAGIGLSD